MTDVTGPLFYATVVDQGGNTEAIREDDYNVMSFTYTDSVRKADKVELTLWDPTLKNFDNPVWKQGNRIRIFWGYPGNLSLERTCVIRSVKGFTKLKVEAHGLAVVMNMRRRSRTFENMTRSEVVRQVAEENGYNVDSIEMDETDERFDHIVQANQTDAQFVRRLAHLQGFEFFVGFDGFHFHEPRLNQTPFRTLTYFVDQQVAEVKSINIKNDVTALPGRVNIRRRNPTTRSTTESSADNNTDTNRPTAGGREVAIPSPRDGAFTGTTLPVSSGNASAGSGSPGLLASVVEGVGSLLASSETTAQGGSNTDESGQREAQARFRRSLQRAVQMTLTMVGDPRIVAGSVVRVEGIGTRLSGNYYVKEAVHTLANGYELRLDLIKDATGHYARRALQRTGDGLPDVDGPTNRAAQQPQPSQEVSVGAGIVGTEGSSVPIIGVDTVTGLTGGRRGEATVRTRVPDPETGGWRTRHVRARGRQATTTGGVPDSPASTSAVEAARRGSS